MGPMEPPLAAITPAHVKLLAAWALPMVLLASVGLAAPAQADGPVACGSTLTVDTRLRADLYCPSGDGLTLGPNVHLNLGGHKLVGSGSSGTGIASIYGSVSIRNGEVKNWATGILISIDSSDPIPSPGTSVTDVVLRSAPSLVRFGSTLVLTRVRAIDSPVSGQVRGDLRIVRSTFIRSAISLFEASATITRSRLVATTLNAFEAGITINRSRLDGRRTTRLGDAHESLITIKDSTVKKYRYPIGGYFSGADLINSTFTDMRQGVLSNISSGLGSEGTATIRGNTFTRSGVALDPHLPMDLENNTFRNNEAGVVFTGSVPPNTEIWAPGKAVNNTFIRNSGTGLRSDIPGLIVHGNIAKRNGGYGIYAPDAVDLGGDIARGNRLGQCVGVVCSAR